MSKHKIKSSNNKDNWGDHWDPLDLEIILTLTKFKENTSHNENIDEDGKQLASLAFCNHLTLQVAFSNWNKLLNKTNKSLAGVMEQKVK